MIDGKENYKFDLGVKGLLEIKSLYRLNHKKIWLYCGAHKHFKQLNLLSACDVVSGKKVDYVTLNPLVLGTISGTGLLLKGTMEFKIISKKIEPSLCLSFRKNTSWFAIPCERQTIRRSNYLTQLRVLEDIVIDMCPLFNNWDKEYSQKFISE